MTVVIMHVLHHLIIMKGIITNKCHRFLNNTIMHLGTKVLSYQVAVHLPKDGNGNHSGLHGDPEILLQTVLWLMGKIHREIHYY